MARPSMPADRLRTVLQRIQNAADAAGRPVPAVLAVSKTQPADAVAALAASLGTDPAVDGAQA